MKKIDVCVIGSGPAAMTTVYRLAQKNLNTALICVPDLSKDKKYYGETLSAHVIQELSVIGLENSIKKIGLEEINSTESIWGNSSLETKNKIFYPNGLGWIFERSKFEELIKGECNNLNVNIYSNEINKIEKAINGWELYFKDHSNHLWCKFLVIATGRNTPRIFNLSRKLYIDKLVAVIAAFPDNNIITKTNSILINSYINGWFYSIKPNSDIRIITYFTDGDLLVDKKMQYHLNFIKKELKNLNAFKDIISPEQLNQPLYYSIISANTGFRLTSYNERLFVCGDSAQTFDPLSSEGIINAIKDGLNLAENIVEAFSGNHRCLINHEIFRRSLFSKYLKNRFEMYSIEKRWKENGFWKRRQDIESIKSFISNFS